MLTINLGGTAYTITPDGTISPDTVIAQMVGDLLDTGEPIGPQVDEYVGIVGSLDQYPQSVIAAFLDVAARHGLRVGRVELPTEQPVTAGLARGGFDEHGNWHDPGSGEFAKKGTSTAKALIENLFRKLLDDSKRADGTDAVILEGLPSIGLRPGDRVHAKWHDDRVATLTAPDGRKVRVSWDLLAHPEAYARVGTRGEGREAPMPWTKTGSNDWGRTHRSGPWQIEGSHPADSRAIEWTLTHDDHPFIREPFGTLTAAKKAAAKYADEGAALVEARSKVAYYEEAAASGGIVDSPEVDAAALDSARSDLARLIGAPVVNEMSERPAISGKAKWYSVTVDGERFSPNVRTAEPPTYMVLARDEFGWYAAGFSTADNETDARADAEAMAPKAEEIRVVGDLVETDAPPPDQIRTGRRPSLAEEDEGYRNHRVVALNDRTVGVVRQEDRGPDDDTGPWSATRYDGAESPLGPFATMIEAVDALAAHAQANPIDRPTDTRQTFTRTKVSAYSVEHVRGLVDKLNARAERKGLNGRVEMTVSEPYLAADPDWLAAMADGQEGAASLAAIEQMAPKVRVYDVTVTATPVRLGGGWEFAGVVDYATLRDADQGWDGEGSGGVLLHSAAGYQLPDSFREHAVCDDCGRVMPRNKLIVAADAQGNLTRLGTTCVVDVLGHDPAKLLWWESAFRSLSEDEDEAWERPAEPAWGKEDYLYLAAVAIDMFGYGRAGSGSSTRDLIVDAGRRPRDDDDPRLKEFRERLRSLYDTDAEQEYRDRAAKVAEYIKSDAFSKRTEFGQNMAAALDAQFITRRTAGIAAFAPEAYNRAQEKIEAAKASAETPNEWIGTVGDKVELTGTIRRINATEGWNGGTSYIVTIDTDQGVVKTFTSGAFSDDAQEALDAGQPIRFKGTIKDHGEWPRGSGNKETTLKNVTTVLTRAERLRAAASQAEALAENTRAMLHREVPESLEPLVAAAPDDVVAAAYDALNNARAAANKAEPNLPASAGVGDRLIARSIETPSGYEVAAKHRRVVLPDGTMGRLALDTDGMLHVVDLDGNEVVSADTIAEHVKDGYNSKFALHVVDPNPDRDPVELPWADAPFIVDKYVGADGPLTVHPDGHVTRPDGSLADGEQHSKAWSGAAHIAQAQRREAAKAAEAAAAEAVLTNPPAPADDALTLTPEWIEAGPWPQDYAYGARSKKTYRIEPGGDVYLNDKRVTDKTGDKVLLAALTDLGVDKPEEFAPVPAEPETGVDAPIVNELVERPDTASPRIVGSHEVSTIAGSADHAVYLADVRDTPATAVLVDAWRGSLDQPGATRGMQWAAATAFDRPGHAPLGDTADGDRAWLERTAQSYGLAAYDPVSTLRALHARTQALLSVHDIEPDDTVILYRGITRHQFDEWDDHGRPDVMGSAPLAAYSPRFAEAAAVGKGGVMTVRIPAANIVSIGALTSGNDEVIAFPPVDGVPITRFRSAETDAAAAAPITSYRERLQALHAESLAAPGLARFVDAQDRVNPVAELRSGRKTGHWMWYVFPQIDGLSDSKTSKLYALASVDQARDYLAHPVLGPRLIETSEAMRDAAPGKSAVEILGSTVDVMKLRSSMTLFSRAAPEQPVFQQVLDRFFDGEPDPATVQILAANDASLASGSYYGAEYIPG